MSSHYYLTLFKVDGHTKWRANFSGKEDSFAKEMLESAKVKVTETKVYRVHRVTGEIEVK